MHQNGSFPLDQTPGGEGGMEGTGEGHGPRGKEEAMRFRGWKQTPKGAAPMHGLSGIRPHSAQIWLGLSFSSSGGSGSHLQGAAPQLWSFVSSGFSLFLPISFLKYIVFTAHLIWV